MRVLIAEEDVALANFVRKGLESEYYAVDVSHSGVQAHAMAGEFDYDLLMLDVDLTDIDALGVLRQLRSRKPSLPIVALTSDDCAEERIACLDSGADDSLSKPFSLCELTARVRALLRRGTHAASVQLKVADLVLDRVQRRAERAGTAIELTCKEFSLLEYLMLNSGRRLTRSMIIEHVWDLSFDSSTNVVDVYVNYLRRKVDHGFDFPLIHTVRGVGYEIAARPSHN